MSSSEASYAWEEVAKHNTAKSCWVSYRGAVYDVTAWLSKHPGGKRVLLYSAGRDITDLFQSYHSSSAAKVLAKYRIGTLATSEFPTLKSSPFFDTLKARVENHISNKRIDTRSTIWMKVVTVLIVLVTLSLHAGTVYAASSPYTLVQKSAYLLALALGVSLAHMGLYILHDSSHAALTHNPTLWRAAGCVWEVFTGLSFFNWIYQHFLGHHIYTGIEEFDPDLHTNKTDIRRIKDSQLWRAVYSYQWLYLPFLYPLLTLKNIVSDVNLIFIAKSNGRIRMNPMDGEELTFYIASKLGFVILRLAWPIYMLGPGTALTLFIMTEFLHGAWLSFSFQVNHVTISVQIFRDLQARKLSWAELQCLTTLDYGHNALTTFFTGSLNYQVEHHLFPGLSQRVLPEIAPIVKQTCAEFNVPYNYVPTFSEAFMGHLVYLRKMGTPIAVVTPSPAVTAG